MMTLEDRVREYACTAKGCTNYRGYEYNYCQKHLYGDPVRMPDELIEAKRVMDGEDEGIERNPIDIYR